MCPDGEVRVFGLCYNIETTDVLDRSGENLRGEIPEEFCQLTNLRALSLQNNELTGTIPECLGDLSIFEQGWEEILLDDNKLSGIIPDSICNILDIYDTGDNRLLQEGNFDIVDNHFCENDFPWCFFENFLLPTTQIGGTPDGNRTCPFATVVDDCGRTI